MFQQFTSLALATALCINWAGGAHAQGPMHGRQQGHVTRPQPRQRQAIPSRQPAQRSPFYHNYYGPQQGRSPGAQGSVIRGEMMRQAEQRNQRLRQGSWGVFEGVRTFTTDRYPGLRSVRTGVKG